MNRESEKRCPNPLLRHIILENFTDGQAWSTAGMADALGAKLSDALAMRYYKHVISRLPKGDVPAQVRKARRACVAAVIGGLVTDKSAVKEKINGETFYRFPPKTLKHADVKTASAALAPKAPANTKTGLTRSGVVAVIKQHGGQVDFAKLLAAVDPLFSPDIVKWFLAVATAESSRKERRSTPKSVLLPPDQLLTAAKTAALKAIITSLRSSKYVTVKTVTMIQVS